MNQSYVTVCLFLQFNDEGNVPLADIIEHLSFKSTKSDAPIVYV